MTRQDLHIGEADCLSFTTREAAALSASIDDVLVIGATYTTNEHGYALVQLIDTLLWRASLPLGIGMLLSEDTRSHTSALCMSPVASRDQEAEGLRNVKQQIEQLTQRAVLLRAHLSQTAQQRRLCEIASCRSFVFHRSHADSKSYNLDSKSYTLNDTFDSRLFGHSATFRLRAIDEKARKETARHARHKRCGQTTKPLKDQLNEVTHQYKAMHGGELWSSLTEERKKALGARVEKGRKTDAEKEASKANKKSAASAADVVDESDDEVAEDEEVRSALITSAALEIAANQFAANEFLHANASSRQQRSLVVDASQATPIRLPKYLTAGDWMVTSGSASL